jgi:hypothetical protein
MDDRRILCPISSFLILNILGGVHGNYRLMQYLRTSGEAEYMHALWESGVFQMSHRTGRMHSLFTWQVIFE